MSFGMWPYFRITPYLKAMRNLSTARLKPLSHRSTLFPPGIATLGEREGRSIDTSIDNFLWHFNCIYLLNVVSNPVPLRKISKSLKIRGTAILWINQSLPLWMKRVVPGIHSLHWPNPHLISAESLCSISTDQFFTPAWNLNLSKRHDKLWWTSVLPWRNILPPRIVFLSNSLLNHLLKCIIFCSQGFSQL